jgi:PAS domain S-box-containing protein
MAEKKKKTTAKKTLLQPPMTDMILESISDGVFTVDRNWIITSFNRAAENITGIKRTHALGSHCYDVFKSNMCSDECPLRKTLKSGKPLINKAGYIINLKGDKKPISVSTALLYDAKGNVIGGAETFRDISEIEELKKSLKARVTLGDMTTNSPAMEKLFTIIPAVAESVSTVLIQGETGTGKELLARTIHEKSPRRDKPFIAINCGALPDTLLESELFGYKKGAFTGADKDKPGRFALAKGGTLFLDEIGDISPAMQVKLLRVLQEKEYEMLGSVTTEKADVRVICAANRNLKEMAEKGEFRKDLYYRVNIVTLELPPLKERREDIPHLAEHFLSKYNRVMNKDITGFSPEVYSFFYSHNWPGNIRELENVIERAVLLCDKKRIEINCLSVDFSGVTKEKPLNADLSGVRQEAERAMILKALGENDNSRIKTAKSLGIDKATLYRKMAALGISEKRK